ncbi:MAG: right-handed parallel beta-helix repeat-containing protein [Candidatus Bathyarchaeota archaeon]|nr:right-handed parallel beta-helix repeat-containing protein [Candidatus Bathyarchaeota archaeon]
MMKLSKTVYIVILVLSTTLSLLHALPVEASTSLLTVHNIETGLDYATIQEAINADSTLNGHTIEVDAGVYYENIVVNKSLSLMGESRFDTVIDGMGIGSVVSIEADGVNITGFAIRNGEFSGVHISNSKGNNASYNVLTDNYNGIYLKNSSGNICEGNFVSSSEYGLHIIGSWSNFISGNNISANSNGVHLVGSNNSVIFSNEISSNILNGIFLSDSYYNNVSVNMIFFNGGRGIRLRESQNNVVSDNKILNNNYGLDFYSANNNTLFNNDISDNDYGIWLFNSGNNSFIRLNVSLNSEDGSVLIDSRSNVFSYSNFSGNKNGIHVENSDDNLVFDNEISYNSEYGLRLWNSSFNTIFHNNFIENLINVEQPRNSSFSNLWDNGVDGNFWGDYTGLDGDKDGVGDTPYSVDERSWLGVHSRDGKPLMAPLSTFRVIKEGKAYSVEIVTNSTLLEFHFHPSLRNETQAIGFRVGDAEKTVFCRISIPHVVVKPSYTISVGDESPLFNRTVFTNGTRTWLYFEYSHAEDEIMIEHAVPPPVVTPQVWQEWWFWAMIVLAAVITFQFSASMKYRRAIERQKKLLELYSPLGIARALFEGDVSRRRAKIKRFEEKYGIRIKPRESLEEVIRRLREAEEKT